MVFLWLPVLSFTRGFVPNSTDSSLDVERTSL
jgi:hypothetical protein